MRSSQSGADGAFEINCIAPGEVELRATHRSWVEARVLIRGGSGGLAQKDIQLGKEDAVLTLVVHDTGGEPVKGAKARLFTPEGEQVGWDRRKYADHYRPKFEALGRPHGFFEDLWKKIMQTDASGRIQRRFLRPGDYIAEVACEGFQKTRQPVAVRLGNEGIVQVTLRRKK
jgi:hypothetical protein